MKGWFHESHRHYLASRGITTRRMKTNEHLQLLHGKPGVVQRVHGIPITVEKVTPGTAYPIQPRQVEKHMERTNPEKLKGLKGVAFVRPKTQQQREAYAQYVRSQKKVLIFSQPVSHDGRIDGRSPKEIHAIMNDYVVPHELAHHDALSVHNMTDKELAMAEARADAGAFGMAVDDRDAVMFKKFHEHKK